MGQVYIVFVADAVGVDGSNAIPHFGQASGWSLSTPGHIGQIYDAFPESLALVRDPV